MFKLNKYRKILPKSINFEKTFSKKIEPVLNLKNLNADQIRYRQNKNNPEYMKKLRERWKRKNEKIKMKRKLDPEYKKHLNELEKIRNKRRRKKVKEQNIKVVKDLNVKKIDKESTNFNPLLVLKINKIEILERPEVPKTPEIIDTILEMSENKSLTL